MKKAPAKMIKKSPAKMAKKSPAKMMKKSPAKKALVGKQKNLPKELRDKILASPAKMLKPAAMKLMKKSPAKMAPPKSVKRGKPAVQEKAAGRAAASSKAKPTQSKKQAIKNIKSFGKGKGRGTGLIMNKKK